MAKSWIHVVRDKVLGSPHFNRFVDYSRRQVTKHIFTRDDVRNAARTTLAKWLMQVFFSNYKQPRPMRWVSGHKKRCILPHMEKDWYSDPEFMQALTKKPLFKKTVPLPIDHKYRSKFIKAGPAHPAARGVLPLIVQPHNETVKSADPHIRLLPRGTEKLPYLQVLPPIDRFDYVSCLANEQCYSLALEKLLAIEMPRRAKYIRTLFSEVMRLTNHTVSVSSQILNCGGIPPLFREFFERASGARMHTAYIRPGGVATDIPLGFCDDIFEFISKFCHSLDGVEEVVTDNRIWRIRNKDIGTISSHDTINYGCSGPTLRATGVKWDLSTPQPYDTYAEMDFTVPVGMERDFLYRLLEILESCRMIRQCINNMSPGEIKVDDYKVSPPLRAEMKLGMKQLNHHLKYLQGGMRVPPGCTYTAVESPKGELGVYLVSDGMSRPYRCKIRAAGFAHLAVFEKMSRPHMLADLCPIIGSLDIALGESDR